MEDEIVNKRRALATHRKEMTRMQFLDSYHQTSAPAPTSGVTGNITTPSHPERGSDFHSFNLFEKENHFHAKDPEDSRRFQSNKTESQFETNSSLISRASDLEQLRVDEELRSAKRVMAMAKDGLNRSSQRKLQSERFLKSENNFLSKIHRGDSR
jgi:hypothetical protein